MSFKELWEKNKVTKKQKQGEKPEKKSVFNTWPIEKGQLQPVEEEDPRLLYGVFFFSFSLTPPIFKRPAVALSSRKSRRVETFFPQAIVRDPLSQRSGIAFIRFIEDSDFGWRKEMRFD